MILHLTRDYPPRRSGGLSTAVGSIVAGLEAAGVATRVLTVDAWGRKGSRASDELPPGRDTNSVRRVRGDGDRDDAAAWAASAEPTLIHVHEPLLWPLASDIASSLGGVPRAHTLHVLATQQDQLRGLCAPTRTTLAQRRALDEADRVIAPSQAVARVVAAEIPDIGPRLRVARLGVPDCPALAAASTGEQRSARRVLFAGRFSDMAGIEDVVALIGELAARAPAATLVVAGGLPDNPRADARWRGLLEAQAAVHGIDVEVLGWLQPHALVAELARASVFIAPSRFATFGFAVSEAMLAGLAVCAYPAGGLSDLIEDGLTGRLVREAVPAALAEAVRDLLENPARARCMGASARARVIGELNPDRATEELRAVYAELGALRARAQ